MPFVNLIICVTLSLAGYAHLSIYGDHKKKKSHFQIDGFIFISVLVNPKFIHRDFYFRKDARCTRHQVSTCTSMFRHGTFSMFWGRFCEIKLNVGIVGIFGNSKS